jgi:capsular polysaccharide transport system ATP-binding protein
MIILERATKLVGAGRQQRPALQSVSMIIPSDRRIALIGPSASDNALLIDLLAGAKQLSTGTIERRAQVSFPIGLLRSVDQKMSVRQNIAHVARLHGIDAGQTVDFVRTVLDIGHAFECPYEELSAPSRRSLAQVVGFCLPFDVYLLTDDRIGISPDFKDRCQALFEYRRSRSGIIIPTQSADFIRDNCEMALLLYNGDLVLVDDLDQAITISEQMPKAKRKK